MGFQPESEPESRPASRPAEGVHSPPRAAAGEAGAGMPAFLRGLSAGGVPAFGGSAGAPTIQAKLEVNQPGDVHEQRAEQIASAASSGAGSGCCAGCAAGGPCSGPKVQSKPEAAAPPPRGLPDSAGEPMSDSVRSRVEPAVGADLSDVRVHTDPDSRETAAGIGAKAFTHQNHIYLGPRSSSQDVSLLAHESAHVVQQGEGEAEGMVQRSPADEKAEFRDTSKREFDEARKKEGSESEDDENAPKSPAEAMRRAPKKKAREAEKKFKPKLEPVVAPTVTRTETSKDTAEEAKTETVKQADSPPKPGPGDKDKGEKGEKDKAALKAMAAVSPAAARSQAAAIDSFAAADEVPLTVPPPMEVVPPPPVMPMDAGGKPLQPHAAAEDLVANLSERIQYMREEGSRLRERAAVQYANALRMRANLHLALSGIALAETGLTRSKDHLASRRDIRGQAGKVLDISKQKAEMVGAEAPGYVEKASGAREETKPMTEEAAGLVGQNAENTPEDEEAAGKSAEQGEKLSKASGDMQKSDSAIADTAARGEQLIADAAHATETNAGTEERLTGLDETFTQNEERLTELTEHADTARASVEGMADTPDEMMATATLLDLEGQALVDESFALETALHALQADFFERMAGVPESSAGEGGGESIPVQRAPEYGYEDRWTVEAPLSDEERTRRQRENYARRVEELKLIDERSGGDFSRLDAGDKMLLALELTGHNLWGDIKTTDWPAFGVTLIQGFIDPRIGLMGAVYGFHMVFSGIANIFNIEAWKKDPLGNLLKIAADVVTGIAIILGSIALLATAIALLLTAIGIAATIFTFGLGSGIWAVLTPIITLCSEIAITVGPWAITWAEVALVLQALVLIKNLVTAACAKTADELAQSAEKMTVDAERGAQMAAMIIPAKVMGGGGKGPKPPAPGLKPPPPPGVVPEPIPPGFGLRPALAGGPEIPGGFGGPRGIWGPRGAPEPIMFKGPAKGPATMPEIPGFKPTPKPGAPKAPTPIEPSVPMKPAAPKPGGPTEPAPVKPAPKPAAPEPVKPAAPEPVKPAAPEPVKPAAPEPVKPAAPEPVKPAAPEPVKPAAPEPVKPAAPEPVKPAAPEPVKPAAPEPVKPAPTKPAPTKPAPAKPAPAKPAPAKPAPAKPAPAKPATKPGPAHEPWFPGFPEIPPLPEIWPHPMPVKPPPRMGPEPDVDPNEAIEEDTTPEPEPGPGPEPGPEPEPEEPDECPEGSYPINWPSPDPWVVHGIGDTGSTNPANNKPADKIIYRQKPPGKRKDSVKNAYINNPVNTAALKAAAKAGKKGQIHHKWPLFVSGGKNNDHVDNLVWLETKPTNRHSAWHQQLYRQKHGYILWDPNGTPYCVL